MRDPLTLEIPVKASVASLDRRVGWKSEIISPLFMVRNNFILFP